MSASPTFPHEGIRVHQNAHGITVARLHYSADPEKIQGEKTLVREIDRELSPWALRQYRQMTDPNLYIQEYEIDAEATLGRQIFNLDEEASCEPSFPIDPKWTRRLALDPHPSVPNALLWVATDRWGDRWYYRELWPSKVSFRFDNGRKLGKAGPCPEDDVVIPIKDYVATMRWLESAENPENTWRGQSFDEQIYARVIDYAARAFGLGTSDDVEQPNFQRRFEQYMVMPDIGVTCPFFEDAKKDHDTGFEFCNAGLKTFMVEKPDGTMKKTARIHIFADKCPELIYQLKNVRRQVLTPAQAATKDPTGKPVMVRTHLADCFRYLEMANPRYIDPDDRAHSNWKPRTPGIAY